MPRKLITPAERRAVRRATVGGQGTNLLVLLCWAVPLFALADGFSLTAIVWLVLGTLVLAYHTKPKRARR